VTSGAPLVVLHCEYYFSGGAFRVGPPIPEFDEPMDRFVLLSDTWAIGLVAGYLPIIV
jgi:peptide/nickel transport system substrate-binding protein